MENTITVVGNITRDPELTFLDGGLAILKFSIAVNRRWKDRNTQEWVERVSYFNIVARGPVADNASSSITKGTRVVVFGRVEQRSWETDGGDTRSTVEINAEEVGPSLRYATAKITKTPRPELGRPVNGPRQTQGERVRNASFPGDRSPARDAMMGQYDEEPF